MRLIRILLITILSSLPACQPFSPTPSAAPPLARPPAAQIIAATSAPRPISTPTLLPTATSAPPSAAVSATPQAVTVIGYSALGTRIEARHIGAGARVLLLVGGVHGGYEINTVALIDALAGHFAGVPAELPPDTALTLIRALNVDGLAYPGEPRGRFNANGVDLNRNWACGWQQEAFWRSQRVNAGAAPLSEPETAALAAYIQAARPAAALFYHSAAGGVFAGDCENDRIGRESQSGVLSAVVGAAAGYTYGAAFSAYPVTGTAPSWVDGLGIPAADVELLTSTDAEFMRNLAGVRAALAWISGRAGE